MKMFKEKYEEKVKEWNGIPEIGYHQLVVPRMVIQETLIHTGLQGNKKKLDRIHPLHDHI